VRVTGGQDLEGRRYGTLEGVFVPTLLTILGVILFLRTGWVMGNAGLVGGIGIILLAFVITGTTVLSMASVSTNVAPAAGGAYALVARSFGVEAGGAVGVPLYLSQSLVIVLYVFGFRDGWLAIFPDHPPALIDVAAVLALVVIVMISTKVAFRIQFVILGIVAIALVAVAVAAVTQPPVGAPPAIGTFSGAAGATAGEVGPWVVFAVFFPATTGIMAGLNMSGELRDPRHSIPRGSLAAVGVSLVIYVAVAVWLAYAATTDELLDDYFVLANRSAWAPAVLAGLLAATFSSALASLVGAPRILQALAEHRVTPAASWLARRDRRGEPRPALLITIVIVAAAILLRDLNAIAPLITLVFLVTYGSINLAVLAETLVDLPSYRPTFRVPWPVPLVGVVGCFGAMLVIDAWFTLLALLVGLGVLTWLVRRDLARPVTDIRAAALLRVAQSAGRMARRIPRSDERTWAPHLLVPIHDLDDVDPARDWVPSLVPKDGPARLVAVSTEEVDEQLRAGVDDLRDQLEAAGVDASTTSVEVAEAERGPTVALLASGDDEDPGAANVVVAGFPGDAADDTAVRRLLRDAFESNVGVVLVPQEQPPQPSAEDGPPVVLWVRAQGPRWQLERHLPHSDLALLVAYQAARSWDARIVLATAIGSHGDPEPAEHYLREVAELARLPGSPEVEVIPRPFAQALAQAPAASLHVLALSTQVDFDWLREVRDGLDGPCLFVRDSGVENAFA
jgi:solute carrier family 12 (sodium/potassium/chloride transporter), member 2